MTHQAHPKLRVLAGWALGAALVIAGCGEPVDGIDELGAGADSTAVERLDAAAAAGPPLGAGAVEKPAGRQPPAR